MFICTTASSRWASALSGASDSVFDRAASAAASRPARSTVRKWSATCMSTAATLTSAHALAGSSAAARSNKPRAVAKLSEVKPLFSQAQP